MEGASMSTNDDIKTLRKKLLAQAKSIPLSRQHEDSKAAKIRALYPDLKAIKDKSPKVSYAALARMLQNIGVDAKADSVRKIMQEQPRLERDANADGTVDGKTRTPRMPRKTTDETISTPPCIPPSVQAKDGERVVTEDEKADGIAAAKTHLDAFEKRVLPPEL
jgi:hypothetical protein